MSGHLPLALLALTMLIAALQSISIAQTADTPSNPAGNAALQYWQAFAQMPALDEDQEKLLDQWRTVSLQDAAVEKIVADSRKSILYLRRGAHCGHCDWGLDYNDGISMLLPHLAKSRAWRVWPRWMHDINTNEAIATR